jgi:phosphoribosyl-dephospho-CoA transferase
MKNKRPQSSKLNEAELRLIHQLRKHPELMERFRSILEITANAEGPIKKADEIEALLIEEMRRLGNTTMQSWASRVEQTLGEQLKQKDASAEVCKKKR